MRVFGIMGEKFEGERENNMFCGNCGNQIQDQAASCPFCGCQLVAAPQPMMQQAMPQQAVQQFAPQQQVAPQAVPQPAVQQVMPQQQFQPQAVPQPAVQQVMPQQQVQPQAVPMQAAPQAGVPVQAAAAPAISLAPVSVSVIAPKNANKERINLESGAIWYVEITNNVLIISRKGGPASMMFGALGVLVTNAMCSMKPSLTFTADQIRNMSYEKVLGGQLLRMDLVDGKILSIKAKPDVEQTIENWWRSQIQR